jgi:hypothetical protein
MPTPVGRTGQRRAAPYTRAGTMTEPSAFANAATGRTRWRRLRSMQEVGEAGRVGVQDLAGAVAREVVGAARGEARAVAGGRDQGGAGFVGERAVELGVREDLFAAGDHHVVQPRVGGEVPARSSSASRPFTGEVVERDGEEAFAGAGAVAEDRAGRARQAGGEQGERAGGGSSGEVGADAGHGHPARGAPFGGAHAGDGAGVYVGPGYVAGGGEPGAYGLEEGVAYGVHRAVRVGGGAATAREATGSYPAISRAPARRISACPGGMRRTPSYGVESWSAAGTSGRRAARRGARSRGWPR